jgi:hypothetical protein
MTSTTTNKQTPWSESASELYRPSDRRLSVKGLPTFAVPRGQRDGSLRPCSRFSRQEPLLFYQVAPQLYSRGWVDHVPDPLLFFSGSAGNRTRASGLMTSYVKGICLNYSSSRNRWISRQCRLISSTTSCGSLFYAGSKVRQRFYYQPMADWFSNWTVFLTRHYRPIDCGVIWQTSEWSLPLKCYVYSRFLGISHSSTLHQVKRFMQHIPFGTLRVAQLFLAFPVSVTYPAVLPYSHSGILNSNLYGGQWLSWSLYHGFTKLMKLTNNFMA